MIDSLTQNNTLYLIYYPSKNYQNPTLPAQPIQVEIGNNSGQISLALAYQIVDYINAPNKDSNSFKAILAQAMYNTMSPEEKSLFQALKADTLGKNISSSNNTTPSTTASKTAIGLQNNASSDDYSLLSGVPTDAYLREIKAQDELDFKNRELQKFIKKMKKISGNEPLEEMIQDATGTAIKFSNLHVTDFNKLDNLKIHSPYFS